MTPPDLGAILVMVTTSSRRTGARADDPTASPASACIAPLSRFTFSARSVVLTAFFLLKWLASLPFTAPGAWHTKPFNRRAKFSLQTIPHVCMAGTRRWFDLALARVKTLRTLFGKHRGIQPRYLMDDTLNQVLQVLHHHF